MKHSTFILATVLAFSAYTLQGCQSSQNPLSYEEQYGYCDNEGLQTQLNSYSLEALNATETASLLRMREEEKLAHDVYSVLYQKWGSQVFSNIAASEQTHMDAMLLLLQRYSISDPNSTSVGVFRDTVLQGLYNQLINLGLGSLSAAFTVGATIEDLDIADLKTQVLIDNKDIQLVYGNLTRGSRNHMRAFTRNLNNLGLHYTPQYITTSEYNAIINGDMESGGCGRLR